MLIIAFTFALSANYIFAVWTGPTQAPPGGNTPTPVHIGAVDQVKYAGLALNYLAVFGASYFEGNVGIGTMSPTEKLDVNGGVKVGNTTNTNAGTIRWTGADLEVYNGTEWKSLTGGGGGGGGCPAGQEMVTMGSASICLADGASINSGCTASGRWGQVSFDFSARYLNGVIQTRTVGRYPYPGCDSGWVNGLFAECIRGGTGNGSHVSAQTSVKGIDGAGEATIAWSEGYANGNEDMSCTGSGYW